MCLFNDAVSSSDYNYSVGWYYSMIDELERIWKEAIAP
jgi:hypothetical protein